MSYTYYNFLDQLLANLPTPCRIVYKLGCYYKFIFSLRLINYYFVGHTVNNILFVITIEGNNFISVNKHKTSVFEVIKQNRYFFFFNSYVFHCYRSFVTETAFNIFMRSNFYSSIR